MKDALKLFVWEGVLSDYTSGIIFALAYDVEEARELVLKKMEKSNNFGNMSGHENESPWNQMNEEPKVYDYPVGYFLGGGG